jgi:hypothetical protein
LLFKDPNELASLVNQVVRLTEDAHIEIEGILAHNLIHHWDEPNGVFKNRSI